jgi:hypothetical protein
MQIPSEQLVRSSTSVLSRQGMPGAMRACVLGLALQPNPGELSFFFAEHATNKPLALQPYPLARCPPVPPGSPSSLLRALPATLKAQQLWLAVGSEAAAMYSRA